MLRIKTLEDGKKIWLAVEEICDQKDIAPVISEDRKKYYTEKLTTVQKDAFDKQLDKTPLEKEKLLQAVNILQKQWKKTTEVKVNPQGNHSRFFSHFMAWEFKDKKMTGIQVKKSRNHKKLDELFEAITTGNWEAKILHPTTCIPEGDNTKFKKNSKEHELSMLALSLYDDEKISRFQMYTLMQYAQTVKQFGLQDIYKILDKKGEFTSEAKEYLIPLLQKRNYLPELTSDQMKEFKLLVQALPLSEQIFYIVDNLENSQLRVDLAKLDTLFPHDKTYTLLSTGADAAFTLAIAGLEAFVPTLPMLGEKDIHTMEKAIRKGYRPCAVNFFDTTHYTVVHHYPVLDDLGVFKHDYYHGLLMSLILTAIDPISLQKKGIRMALLKSVDMLRDITHIPFSKEQWLFLDGNCGYFLYYRKDINFLDSSNKNITTLWCHSLLFGLETNHISNGGFFLMPSEKTTRSKDMTHFQWNLTSIGALYLIHSYTHKKEWMAIGIDPDHFTKPFAEYYKEVAVIYDEIKANAPIIQIIKLQAYIALKKDDNLIAFAKISALIDKNESYLLKKLQFIKIKKSQISEYHALNATAIAYDKKEIAPPAIKSCFTDLFLKNIIADLHFKDHPSKFLSECDAFAKSLLMKSRPLPLPKDEDVFDPSDFAGMFSTTASLQEFAEKTSKEQSERKDSQTVSLPRKLSR